MTANPLSTIPPIGPTTGMAPPPPSGRFKPIDPVRLLRQHIRLMIVTGILGLMVGAGVYYFLRQTSPQYTSQAQLLVDNRTIANPWALPGQGTAVRSSDIASLINNEVELIMSEEIIREALGRPEAQKTAWLQGFQVQRQAREAMQKDMLSVSMIRGTTLINLSMTAPRPEDARDLLEAVIETYLTNKRLKSNEATSNLRRSWLAGRDRAEDEVRNLRRQMDRFITDNELASLRINASDAQRTYDSQLAQSLDISFQLDAARGSYESLRQGGASAQVSDEENAYLKTLPSIARRQEELIALAESRRQLLASGMGEQHPQVRQLDRRRDAVQFELDREMEKETAELRALKLQLAARQVESLTSQLESLRPQLNASSLTLQQLNQKLAEYGSLETELAIALERRQTATTALDDLTQIAGRDETVNVQRRSSPTEANMTSPKWVLIPMITFLFLGLVGGLVVLREMLDQRVRSPMDLKLLPEANLLGLVPDISEDPTGGNTADRTVERSPTGLLAESYRQIRTAILAKMDRRGYKTLVCVAAQPQAGTSTVVQNLATSLAFNGRSVLIIDANFRRPRQHELLDVPNDHGLVDILKDEAVLEDVVVNHADTTLSLLPTGRAADAPPELLEAAAFRGLLGQLENQYDLIIIDAPPALLTSDSQLLSKHVDAIAVVARAGSDKRGMLGRTLSQLDGQRADLLGVILNGVKSAAGGYFRKSYEEFYRYRQDDTLNAKRGDKARGKPVRNGKADRGLHQPLGNAPETPVAVKQGRPDTLDEQDLS